MVLAVKGKEGAAYKVLFSLARQESIYIIQYMYTGIFLGSVYGGEGYTDKSVLVKGFYLGVQLPQKGLFYS